MINRRLLRIKVFQSLYAYYQNNTGNDAMAEKNLMHSLEKMYELFLINLSLLSAIGKIEKDRQELHKQKFYQNNQTKRLFYDNLFISALRENENLIAANKHNSAFWNNAQDVVKKIVRTIETCEEYIEYTQSSSIDIKSDAAFVLKIYKKYIYTDESLTSFLEETNIHWAQDQYYVGLFVISFIKTEGKEFTKQSILPTLFKPVDDFNESDELYVKKLLKLTITKSPEYEPVIYQNIKNWEPDRIALSDTILLKMAVTEILNFDQIPIKSSINEYIELAKVFSTPKSKIFINGVLDKVISHYKLTNEIHKIGRGLKEN
jgi:N utilization substance protein B